MQTLPLRIQNWVTDIARGHPSAGEPPLRAELFSVEQLARHAKSLATNHQVVTRQGTNNLLSRLGQNEDILRTFNRATLSVIPGRRITPAAEWLLDNFYLIEEQIQIFFPRADRRIAFPIKLCRARHHCGCFPAGMSRWVRPNWWF